MKSLLNIYPGLNRTEAARKLGISRSMFYYKYKRPLIDEEVKHQIESVLVDHKDYGHKRIALHLKLNKKRILRVMKKFDIKPYRRRAKRFVKKQDLNKPDTKIKNEIAIFCPVLPNIIWVTDFTYIKYQGKFLYLAVIMDLCTREILGVNISRYHNKDLVLSALIDAIDKTKTTPKYIHSDQGSEYDSKDYVSFVKSRKIILSMSRKSSPWENGHQESYFSGFKVLLGDVSRFKEEGELIEEIYQNIYYYNNRRIHTSLKMPPVEFRKILEDKLNNFRLHKSIKQKGT